MNVRTHTFGFLVFLCLSFSAFGQKKVVWELKYDEENKEVILTASVVEGWHLYSQHTDPNVGPVPTAFRFEENDAIQFIDKVQEPEPTRHYDRNFEGEVLYFEGDVNFRQKVEIKENTRLKGTVVYMVCNDEMCLPPSDMEFEIKVEKQ